MQQTANWHKGSGIGWLAPAGLVIGGLLMLAGSTLSGSAAGKSRAVWGKTTSHAAAGTLAVAHWDGTTTDVLGMIHIRGTAVNDTGQDLSYTQVTVRLLDASGAQVGSALANTADLPAGTHWRFEAIGGGDGVTRWELGSITGF